jgi:hypothetical protein
MYSLGTFLPMHDVAACMDVGIRSPPEEGPQKLVVPKMTISCGFISIILVSNEVDLKMNKLIVFAHLFIICPVSVPICPKSPYFFVMRKKIRGKYGSHPQRVNFGCVATSGE